MEILEQIKEMMKDESKASEFKAIVKALGYETPEEIAGLKEKNYEILGKHSKLKAEYEEMKKKLDGVDIEEYNQLKESRTQKGNPSETERQLKKFETELKAEREARQSIEQRYHGTLTERELSRALEANKYTQHKPVLQQILQGRSKVEIIEGKEVVTVRDDSGYNVPVDEYFKTYFPNTEIGKNYADKPVNTGAGAHSISGGGSGKRMPESQFNKLPPREQAKIVNSGVDVTKG